MRIQRILLDMDGVLFDLDARMAELYGEEILSKQGWGDELIKFVDHHGGFAELTPIDDAHHLVEGVLELAELNCMSVMICTSHGSFHPTPEVCGKQKQESLRRHFPQISNIPFLLTPGGAAKAKFARNSVLIDDVEYNINEFTAAGGKGILHRSAKASLAELNQIIRSANPWLNSIRL